MFYFYAIFLSIAIALSIITLAYEHLYTKVLKDF